MPDGLKPWTSVYLVDFDEAEDLAEIVRRHYADVFEEQLESWHLDEDAWPSPRTFDMFQQWFHIETAEPVFDLSDEPIEHED